MDARDLSEQIFKVWQENYPKDSGMIHKSLKPLRAVVWTDQGYKDVVGVQMNKLGFVEIILDEE